jgi:RNA polymerase sigma-70 factor (sigma-E family)
MGTKEQSEGRDFAEYFAARRDAVRRTAYLLCGDWHWADDLTQIAFVRLASGWNTVRERAALDAFVRTCLVRAYLAETRRMWRRRERGYLNPPEVSTGDQTDRVVSRLAIIEALKQVPPRQRATIVCRFYQGLGVEQTAEVLDCSVGTVKSQTARGLATLRGVLGDTLTIPAMDEVRT